MNKTKKGIAVLTLAGMLSTVAPVCAFAEEAKEAGEGTAAVAAQTENTQGEAQEGLSEITLVKDTVKAGSEALEVMIKLADVEKADDDTLKNLQVWVERVDGERSGFDKVDVSVNEQGEIIAKVVSDIMGQVVIKAAKGDSVDAVIKDKSAQIGSANGVFSGTATMYIGENSFTFNDKTIPLDVAPFIQNSRTLVPIRALSEACGATVVYDQKMETISISLGSDIIKMKLGAANMEKNGQILSNDAVAQVTAEGRAVLPFRAIAEALDFNVEAILDDNGAVKAVTFTNVEPAAADKEAEVVIIEK